jgi:copper transport protein
MTDPGVPVATGRARRGVTRTRRSVAAGILSAGIVLGWAGMASAHASVVSSSPASGAHLAHAPGVVTVDFDQPVKPDNGGLVVLDSNGAEVNAGASRHPSPDVLQVALPPSLGNGAYVANYTVTSVDGHVVSGGIVFLVGHATAGQIGQLARRPSTGPDVVDKVGQFLTYLGVLAAGGLAFFLAFLLGDGLEQARLRRCCVAASIVGVTGMVVTSAAQAALTGGGWAALAHWGVDQQAAGGKLGAQSALQLVGLGACLWSFRLCTAMGRQFASFYGMLVSAGAFVVFGHALVSRVRWLSTPADVVHVVFAAMWVGGLIGLVVVLRSRTAAARGVGEIAPSGADHAHPTATGAAGGGDPVPASARAGAAIAVLERTAPPRPDAVRHEGVRPATPGGARSVLASTTEVVGRFSTMAGVSVIVIGVAGVLLAVAEVGSFTNLIDTSYGQILLVKVALVGALAFVAGYNRFLLLPVLMSHAAGRPGSARLGAGWRRLLGTVRVEALGVVAVLAVTSVLANSTPSNGAAPARPVPFAQTQPFEGGHLSLRITPNQALVNNFVVQFTGADGAPANKAESVSVYLTLPSENVGPIETDMTKVGVGRFVLTDTPDPPIIGNWQITLQVQVSEFDEPDASFVDDVR